MEPSPGDEAAAFVAAQLVGDACLGLAGQRIVLLGPLPRRSVSALSRLQGRGGWDERIRLCARLLMRGAQLVVLDCPRSRLQLETLLPLAADGDGRWQGDCLVERDLPSACRGAAALVLLPGWREPPSLSWKALASRMRPQALLFDLRTDAAQLPPPSSGLRVWWLGGCCRWG